MASTSNIMPWNSTIDNLCIVFAVCVMLVKVYKLTLTLNKVIILAIISLFVLYSCVTIGQYDLLISLIAICLLIDEDMDEYISVLFKTQVFILVAHIVVSTFLTLIGADAFFWGTTGSRVRFNGGFSHANVLSSYILSCMLMFAWKNFKHLTTNKFAWMVTIVVLSYIMTRSRTGLLLNIILLLLVYFAQNESKLLVKTINPILFLLFPVLTVFVFWAQGQFLNNNGAIVILDQFLTGRIKYAAYAFIRSGTTWLPRYLDYATEGVAGWTPEWNLNTFTFDNLYSFLFIQMGIVWVGIITAMIVLVCKKCDFKFKIFKFKDCPLLKKQIFH